MRYPSLADLVAARPNDLAKGPLALVMAEDEVEIDSTVSHLLAIGCRDVVLLCPEGVSIRAEDEPGVHLVSHDVHAEAALPDAVNSVMDHLPGTWIHACFNAEYLYFPFSDQRSLRELVAHHGEERRDAMMTYVIDLYAGDLSAAPNGVSLTDTWFDRSGYFALPRTDASRNWEAKDRQIDLYGGLRRRFEEHVTWERRRIDRISLFRARPGLRLRPDFTLSDEEMNTYACAWHHNLTATVGSFRAAKALRTNPGSRQSIQSFRWRNSEAFAWNSSQLLELGFMEPGQWI